MALFGRLTEAALELFEYNRGNFQYDREMRQKMEYELAEMKIKQTETWREDIREISELTPEKIEVYLLIIALELGFCVMALAKGRVPPGAPPWLVACHTISVCAALMYFTLAMWFGMHAFVSAQAYKVRILTQLVRAPVPTWRTLEAARTYGSSFERIHRRQMFRIPFLGGPQEGVGRGARRAAPAGPGGAPPALPPVDEDVEEGATADPWHLERPGTDISELAPDVNTATERQRHIWLVREAQKFYQTYDAFCRICMSAGTSSLAVFFCYFCLSRVLTELAAPAAAWGGMVIFISCSLVVMHSDLQLKRHQYVVLSVLKFLPPVISAIVTFHCSKNSGKPGNWEFLMPLALLTHGAGEVYYLFLFNVKEVQTGALLPTAFAGILFLDPFALARHTGTWYKRLRESTFGARATASRSRVNQSFGPSTSRSHMVASSAFLAPTHGAVQQPEVAGALPATSTFELGAPARPEDVGGSPTGDDEGPGQPLEGPMPPSRGFRRMSTRENISFRPGSFAQSTHREEDEVRHNIQTGNDIMGEKPGLVPWRVFFLNTSVLTVLWWIAAGVALHNAIAGAANFVPSNYEDLEDGKVAKMAELIQRLPDKFRGHRILTTWGNQTFMPQPTGLACDPQGLSFVTTGITADGHHGIWNGRLSGDQRSITFDTAPWCPDMEALDSVQDLAVHGCSESEDGEDEQSCSLLVLPKHATSLVSCPLVAGDGEEPKAGKKMTSATQLLARAWLSDRGGVAQNAEDAEHFLIPEDVASLAVAPCGKGDAECAVLGTTGQRVVLMDAVGKAAEGKSPSVVPRRLLHSDHGEVPGAGAMAVVDGRYLAVLLRDSGNVRMLDMQRGGADSGVWRLPKPTANQGGGGKWNAICGVGDSFYALEEGDNPSLWRFPAPDMKAGPHGPGFIHGGKPLPAWTKNIGFVHVVFFVPIALIAFFRYVDLAWFAELAGCEDVYSFWLAVHTK